MNNERNLRCPGEQAPHNPDLRVAQQMLDKNFMVAFDGSTNIECDIYNSTIQEILEKENFRPFHQVGDSNEPGYHAWEVWVNTDRATLLLLLPKIKARVKELKKQKGIE